MSDLDPETAMCFDQPGHVGWLNCQVHSRALRDRLTPDQPRTPAARWGCDWEEDGMRCVYDSGHLGSHTLQSDPCEPAPATEDCAECASGSCCHGHRCDGPKGCMCPSRPALPRTPAAAPDMGVCARCDEPAVVMITDAPGNGRCAVHAAAIFPQEVPPDQMTALERQLTAQIVLWRQAGEAWAARADELAAQSAVVEAARDVVADIENDGSIRSSTLAKLQAALDALDGSHAAPDEAHSRL